MPSLAAKLHLRNIQKVLSQALAKSQIIKNDIDYVAYTEKPGLIICLQIGKIVAETLSLYLQKPLISCNHLEAHVYSNLLEKKKRSFASRHRRQSARCGGPPVQPLAWAILAALR